MTRQEIQKKSQEKVNAIQALAKQLQVVMSAEQVVTKQGLIKLVVYYTDNEKYNLEQPVTPKEDEPKILEESEASEGPQTEGPETASLRE